MADAAPWDEVLAHLRALNPKVQTIPCRDEGVADKAILFVPVDRVAYFSSDAKRPGFSAMLATDEGKLYFLNADLGDIETALQDNPRFLRTGKQYLVNLLKVRGARVNRARDLQFLGSETWVANAVSPDGKDEPGKPPTPKYLSWFQARFLSNV